MDSNKATVHLVSLDIKKYINTVSDRDYYREQYNRLNKYGDWNMMSPMIDRVLNSETDFDVLHITDIEDKYPELVPMMKRGDLIENVNESGYRTDGVYCYDGEDIVYLNKRYDDYGDPSSSFQLIKEFPPGYWDNPAINNKFEPTYDSNFYWHCDYAYSTINITEYNDYVINTNNKTITFTHNNKKYIVKYYDKYETYTNLYVRNITADEIRRCNKTSNKLEGVKNGIYHYVMICDR
jgi:hypothetical protein